MFVKAFTFAPSCFAYAITLSHKSKQTSKSFNYKAMVALDVP